ncbi:MAG: CPBP family intramembrane metalloprotease [Deltaproteobacteria bacterium]|nr:MAG: CPBP family intramembrane metalloprotease [Deltaproteobacteria bacterium]
MTPRTRRSRPLGRGDLATSFAFIFPLFVGYELGVVFTPALNGVDFVTGWILHAVDGDRGRYVVVNLSLAVVYVAALWWLRRRRAVDLRAFMPMLLLSAIYALTLGSFIVFVMTRLLGFDGLLATGDLGLGSRLIVAMGAGVHEELVFRLGLLAGGAYLLRAMGVRHRVAAAIAFVASSLLFSAAHHVGPLGDPFTLPVFVYRALAGAAFGAIFYFHSLSHAVYTHFLYDVYVLLFRG